MVGGLLWRARGLKWFCGLQLLAFVGQGLSAVAGEAMTLPSNCFEQQVTWALLVLGWQLQRELQGQPPPAAATGEGKSQSGRDDAGAIDESAQLTASLL
eukprot:SAG22_NODE_673_length_7973_cov_3.643129_6_plen_99_part_00